MKTSTVTFISFHWFKIDNEKTALEILFDSPWRSKEA